jgi:hypothetical protein
MDPVDVDHILDVTDSQLRAGKAGLFSHRDGVLLVSLRCART